jgi:hypothetical protein
MSLLTVSMRFCSASSFDKVLSRNGALNVTLVGDWPLLGRRISSFRGGFLAVEADFTEGADSCCCDGCWPLLFPLLVRDRGLIGRFDRGVGSEPLWFNGR